MARPKKIGIDYFPHDVDMHDNFNVRRLMYYHGGGNAYAVYLTILEFIYKAGYYISVDKFLIFNLAGILKYEEEYITSVIEACVENELFIENLFKNENILTSYGVQKRYIKIALLSNRKIYANEPFLLDKIIDDFNLIPNKTQVMSNKTQVMSVESTQSKVKESKVKKNINTPLPPLGGNGDNNPVDDSGVVLEDNREEGSSLEDTEKIQIRNRERRRNGSLENNDDCETNDNPQGYEKFDLSFIEEPFREAFFEFMEYKRSDQRFKYKSEKSIKTCYNRLVELSEGNPQTASKIVKQAISNGWKGIFKLENNNYETGNNNNGYRTAEDLRQGVVDIISSRAAASKQPKRELPVV